MQIDANRSQREIERRPESSNGRYIAYLHNTINASTRMLFHDEVHFLANAVR